MIESIGLFHAKKRSHEIREYSNAKAKLALEKYSSREDVINFIYLLSRFEFVSFEVLFSIVEEKIHAEILSNLLITAICERLGSNGEYVRVNDVIKDYISRGRFGLPDNYKYAIESHVKDYLKHDDNGEDLSDYLFSVQEAVFSGTKISDDMLIPSILIKAIRKLYDEDRNYRDAISLCERFLYQENYAHANSIKHVRFIKCQCLARLNDTRFFGEVQKISEPDKSFLFGFYYRISGDYEKAKKSFLKVLNDKPNDIRARGELVRVYLQTEEYDAAFEMARKNYVERPGNPININNYFTCLIQKEKSAENREELQKALRRLLLDSSLRAREMSCSAKAYLVAFYDNDYIEAFKEIEEAIHSFPDNIYPLLTKANLAVHSKNLKKLSEAISDLEKKVSKKAQSYRTFLRYKAFLIALQGDIAGAKRFAEVELKGIGNKSLERLRRKIDDLVPRL